MQLLRVMTRDDCCPGFIGYYWLGGTGLEIQEMPRSPGGGGCKTPVMELPVLGNERPMDAVLDIPSQAGEGRVLEQD